MKLKNLSYFAVGLSLISLTGCRNYNPYPKLKPLNYYYLPAPKNSIPVEKLNIKREKIENPKKLKLDNINVKNLC